MNTAAAATPQVTVYSKTACVQCTATYRALDGKGIPYTVVDITQVPEALAYVCDLGYVQAPVVVVDEHSQWSGFRPDCIEATAPALGATD